MQIDSCHNESNPRRKWIYDGQLRIVAEQQLTIARGGMANVSAISRFIYGPGSNTPVAMLRYTPGSSTPTVYRILADILGSPRYIVNAADNNDVLLNARYSAFGMVTVDAGSVDAVPFGFAGGLYDPDTGLVHFGARDYDPLYGRWISKDPILFGGGQANLYVYVGNDPINNVDPSGLRDYSQSETQAMLDEAVANYDASSYPSVMLDALVNNSFNPFRTGQYDFKLNSNQDTFDVAGLAPDLSAADFGNYFAGYVNYGAFGPVGLEATFAGGHYFAIFDPAGSGLDSSDDRQLILRGAFDFKTRHRHWGGAPDRNGCGR